MWVWRPEDRLSLSRFYSLVFKTEFLIDMLSDKALVIGQQTPGVHLYLPLEDCPYRYIPPYRCIPIFLMWILGFELRSSSMHGKPYRLSHLTSPSGLIPLTIKVLWNNADLTRVFERYQCWFLSHITFLRSLPPLTNRNILHNCRNCPTYRTLMETQNSTIPQLVSSYPHSSLPINAWYRAFSQFPVSSPSSPSSLLTPAHPDLALCFRQEDMGHERNQVRK